MTKRKYSPPTITPTETKTEDGIIVFDLGEGVEVTRQDIEAFDLNRLSTEELLTRFQELEAMRAMAKRVGDIDSARQHKEAQHAIRLIIQERTGRYL